MDRGTPLLVRPKSYRRVGSRWRSGQSDGEQPAQVTLAHVPGRFPVALCGIGHPVASAVILTPLWRCCGNNRTLESRTSTGRGWDRPSYRRRRQTAATAKAGRRTGWTCAGPARGRGPWRQRGGLSVTRTGSRRTPPDARGVPLMGGRTTRHGRSSGVAHGCCQGGGSAKPIVRRLRHPLRRQPGASCPFPPPSGSVAAPGAGHCIPRHGFSIHGQMLSGHAPGRDRCVFAKPAGQPFASGRIRRPWWTSCTRATSPVGTFGC